MSYTTILLPRAEKDITAAYKWYEKQLNGLGGRFLSAAKNEITAIAITPEHYSFGKRPFRQHKIPGFPYLIIFRIVARQQTVVISSVFHTSRNPRRKFKAA